MKRSTIAILILSLLTLGCGVCSLAQRKGKEVALTAVATVQTQVTEQLVTATPTAAARPQSTPTPKTGETQSTATPTPKTSGTQPTATPTSKPGGSQPAATSAPGKLAFQPLGELNSYRYEFTTDTVEKGIRKTMKATGAYVKTPPASQIEFEAREGDEPAQVLKFIQVGGATYVYDADQNGWMAMPGENMMAEGFDIFGIFVDEFEDSIDDSAFKLVSPHVDVEGVDCSHYHADAKDVADDSQDSDMTIKEGDVDVWVANKIGYLARLQMDAKGVDKDGDPTSVQLTMRMTDVNQNIQISPPPKDEIVQDLTSEQPGKTPTPGKSEGIAQTLPKPPDADDLSGDIPAQAQAMAQGEDVVFYHTDLSTEEAIQFFESAYGKEGWKKEQSMPMGQMTLLIFGKDGKTANVILSSEGPDKGNTVIVFVE